MRERAAAAEEQSEQSRPVQKAGCSESGSLNAYGLEKLIKEMKTDCVQTLGSVPREAAICAESALVSGGPERRKAPAAEAMLASRYKLTAPLQW